MDDWQRNNIREMIKEERYKRIGEILEVATHWRHHHHHPAHPSPDWSSLNNNGGMGKALVAGIHLAKSLSILEKKMCLIIDEAAPITIR